MDGETGAVVLNVQDSIHTAVELIGMTAVPGMDLSISLEGFSLFDRPVEALECSGGSEDYW